jgi:acyl-CoA thioesterase FadM
VAGEDMGQLRIKLACMRLSNGRPARIPQRWRDALRD